MLFHVTHTHTWETCAAHDKERQAAFAQTLKSAKELGIEIKGVYSNALAHTVYMLLETDSAEDLEEMFDPVLDIGHMEIDPVTDAVAALKRRMGQE